MIIAGEKSYIRFDQDRGKFRVDIGIHGKEYVGRYKKEEEAMIAAKAAENAYRLGYKNGAIKRKEQKIL